MGERGSRSFVFVVPDPAGTVSGGHIYNQQMMDALRRQGCEVEEARLWQAADRMARSECSWFVFDSLYLAPESLSELSQLPLESRSSVFLAHHLESLCPFDGRSGEDVFEGEEWPQLRRFSRVWATSSFMAEYVVAASGGRCSTIMVEPGLDAVQPGSAELHDPPRVLLVANLTPRKAVLDLLLVLADRPRLPDFELRVLGGDLDPQYAESCRSLVAGHPALASRVVFAGAQSPESMSLEYCSGDLLVSAAVVETFGMALQEAMAYGLPLLVRDGGYSGRHLVGQGAGEVHQTVGALADSLLCLLADRQRLSALKRSAHAARPEPQAWSAAAASLVEQLCRG